MMTVHKWWDGEARRALPEEIRNQVRDWVKESKCSVEIERFDALSRLKVALLYLTTIACGALYVFLGESVAVQVAAVLIMGLFSIPYTRVFMHSQMHWGIGGNSVTKWLLDNFISLQFSVPQMGYVYGHRAHHQYDNDLDSNGRPKDWQSTYIFSRHGEPCNPLIWLLFYVFVYQHFVHAFLVFKKGRISDCGRYLMQLGAIIAMHSALFLFAREFYMQAFLPATLIAWVASGIVLYMMHAVSADSYQVHPTNNSLSKFFNRFGDNDGYHIEHTLFASLHPLYLDKLHGLLNIPESQNLKGHYVIEFFKGRAVNKETAATTSVN